MKPKQVTAYRLTAKALKKIARLAKKMRLSKTAVVELAVQEMREE